MVFSKSCGVQEAIFWGAGRNILGLIEKAQLKFGLIKPK